MPLLDVKGLTKTFGGLTAINHVDFSMDEHQIVGVIGPNGAGKTTFFNMISGYYPVDSGSITFDGHSLTKLTPEKVAAYKIARTFQNIRLFSKLSVEDNVKIGLHNACQSSLAASMLRLPSYWSAEKKAHETAMELLSIFDMQHMASWESGSLPYGAQRRLEIVRALATSPKVLLLDEPAAGMNPSETAELTETIRRIRDEFNIAVLLIEHDMSLVMGICEGIAVLNFGRIIAKGTPDEIRNNPQVIEAYLGKKEG